MKKTGWILGAGAAALFVAVVLRIPAREEESARRVSRSRPAAELATLETQASTEPRSNLPSMPRPVDAVDGDLGEEDLWDDIARSLEDRVQTDAADLRDIIVRRTATHLALTPDETRAFEALVRQVRERVRAAWAIREEGAVTSASNIGLDPTVQERVEQEIQRRYEREKEAALEPLAMMLAGDERRQRLRERLEEWFDAVR